LATPIPFQQAGKNWGSLKGKIFARSSVKSGLRVGCRACGCGTIFKVRNFG